MWSMKIKIRNTAKKLQQHIRVLYDYASFFEQGEILSYFTVRKQEILMNKKLCDLACKCITQNVTKWQSSQARGGLAHI